MKRYRSGQVATAATVVKGLGFVVAGSLFVALCGLMMSNAGAVVVAFLLILASACFAWPNVGAWWFAHRVNNTFVGQCNALGMSAVVDRFDVGAQIRESWNWSGRIGTKEVLQHPKLTRLEGSPEQWQAQIVPLLGQSLDDYQKFASSFALAFGVPYVNFDVVENSRIRIRAGSAVVPVSVVHHDSVVPLVSRPGEAVSDGAKTRVLPMAVDEDEARRVMVGVNVAYREDGQPFYLPVEGQHVLIVGRSGAGKGSWIWSTVLGLAPALEAGLCRIWALDPKGIELAFAPHWWYKYADSPDAMLALIEEFREQMNGRKQQLKGVARKFTPSVDMPLNVLLVDELAACTKLMDKKRKEQFALVLAEILTQGRALGYSVVGALQDPRKETIPDRDLFMVRVCLALPEKSLIDMVLGDGSYQNGALCDQIPQGEAGAGTGYVVMPEISSKPLMVRAYWTSDERIQMRYPTSNIKHAPLVPLAPTSTDRGDYMADDDAVGWARQLAGVES